MTTFSANLGFLWSELSLPDAIRAAAAAEFSAIEFHWPYDYDADEIRAVLNEVELPVLGLNTRRGDLSKGENGLSALVGRELEAHDAIDEAITYAAIIGAANVHVMAGFAEGQQAHYTFIDNLRYAANTAAKHSITILIEPLNHYDAPGYFLSTSEQARSIIEEVNLPNLKLMFDCYHLQLMEGNLCYRLESLREFIGHVQIAAVPSRAEPDEGEIYYPFILETLSKLGFDGPIGAEYKPRSTTDEGLYWRSRLGVV